MVNLAFILNSSLSIHYRPVFEILYGTEAVVLILTNVFVIPLVTWIVAYASPLHRNLRYVMICSMIHFCMGISSRTVLLTGQVFKTDAIEWEYMLIGATLCRRFSLFIVCLKFVGFDMGLMKLFRMFGITMERLVATMFWSWYERQGRTTLVVFIVIEVIFEAIACTLSYTETFGVKLESWLPEIRLGCSRISHRKIPWIGIAIFSILLILGLLVYIILFVVNERELAKLSVRGINRYSLARSYQMKENVAVMKMILRSSLTVSFIGFPSFVFMISYVIIPSRFNFLRLLSIAMFDWWSSLATLVILFSFPFVDLRLRRPAYKIWIFRWFMPTRFLQEVKNNTVKETQAGNTEQYFNWLERDWK